MSGSKLILAAMIFAVAMTVAMTFIDQTIVAIAVPELQQDLELSATGVQWVINGYLLSLSALFAFGGRLGDIFGHRSMVVVGVVVFAPAPAEPAPRPSSAAPSRRSGSSSGAGSCPSSTTTASGT